MKGTLEPSAPSIIPNPCTSIFFTIPVILSVLLVQPCSRSASRSVLGWARDFSIHCSFSARGLFCPNCIDQTLPPLLARFAVSMPGKRGQTDPMDHGVLTTTDVWKKKRD